MTIWTTAVTSCPGSATPATGSTARSNRGSDPDRMPDRLGLEEREHPPQPWRARPILVLLAARGIHSLDVFRRQPLKVGAPVWRHARHIDGVHIHVAGKNWREFGGAAGEHVNRPGRHVRGRD